MVYSTDRSKAVVPVLVLLFVALWFILRGDLFYVLPCVFLFLRFPVLLALRLPRLGKSELILVLFVRLFDLCLFGFVGFRFPLYAWEGLRFVIVAFPGLFSYLFLSLYRLIPHRSQTQPRSRPNAALALTILALTSTSMCTTLDNVLLK